MILDLQKLRYTAFTPSEDSAPSTLDHSVLDIFYIKKKISTLPAHTESRAPVRLDRPLQSAKMLCDYTGSPDETHIISRKKVHF